METKNSINKADIPPIIIGKLMNISGILEKEGNRLLMPFGLNQQQFSILFEIAKAGEVQQKDMVNRLLLERAHVSKVVRKLQSRGLIDVTPMKKDKRSAVLSSTQKGKQLVEDCRDVFRNWNMEWFDEFSSDDLLKMLHSLDNLQKTFKNKYLK